MNRPVFFLVGVALSAASSSASSQTTKFSAPQVCRAGVAAVMGRDPKIVKIDRTEGEVFFLSYVRADDGKRWAYKCKVDGARVIWASAEGRWRTHPDDGAVFYSTTNSSVVIEERFADGSKSVKAFTTQQLGN